MTLSTPSEKRSAIFLWIQDSFTIIDKDDNEVPTIDSSKNNDSRACSSSTVKGIAKFIHERGYILRNIDDEDVSSEQLVSLGNQHFESLFVKTPAKPLPTEYSAILDNSLDTDDCKYFGTLGNCSNELISRFGQPIRSDPLHPDFDPEDQWTLEWKFNVNGHTCSIYLLHEHSNSQELEIATLGTPTPEIRLFCLDLVQDTQFKLQLSAWKSRSRSTTPTSSPLSSTPLSSTPPPAPIHRILESIDLDDL
jgi:hypothetical protein